jgi:diguanylate cyclase (GGDEF)-like protein
MRRLSTVSAGALSTAAGAASVVPLWALPPVPATAVVGLMHIVALSVAAAALLRNRSGGRPIRRSRRLFAFGLATVTVGNAVSIGFVVLAGAVPTPSVADPIILSWVPLAAYGFWTMPSRDRGLWSRQRMLVDAALGAAAFLLISWILVVAPLTDSTGLNLLGRGVLTTYPLSDVVVAAIAFAVFPRVRPEVRPFVNCAALGLLLIAVSDSGIALQVAQRGGQSFGWPDVVMQGGLALLIFGAALHPRPIHRQEPSTTGRDQLLIYVPVFGALTLVIGRLWSGNAIDHGQMVLGPLMIVVLVVRQVLLARELSIAAEAHRYAASHDALTGLANRKAFVGQLTEHLAREDAPPAAVLFADLDGFKAVNDTMGHERGDRLLQDFSRHLASVAGGNLVARLGGDEFAVLVCADDPERVAQELAARLVHADQPIALGCGIACSSGIAGVRAGDMAGDVLRRADLAMYSVKRSRQRRTAVYDEAMAAPSERRRLVLAALPGAIDRGELHLVYQPLFDLNADRLVGARAQPRWRHPSLGDILPDEFILGGDQRAELVEIGSWMLGKALAQLWTWQNQGCVVPQLFLEVTPAELTDEFPSRVASALHSHAVPAQRLVLEVSEHDVDASQAGPAQVLRERGVRIAVRDLGSVTVGRLAHLAVDVLMVEADSLHGADRGALAGALLAGLSTALGVDVVGDTRPGGWAGLPMTAEKFGALLGREFDPQWSRAATA